MLLAISVTAAVSAIAIYWYNNRHKPLIHLVLEIKSIMNMNLAGMGGMIDDWINFWRNKIELPDRQNKVAVVTGGGRGIGKEVVRQLLKTNMDVVVGIRNPELVKKIAESMENSERLHAFKLDLQSLKSVKSFADDVTGKFPKINYLINNAGIMYGDYKLTEDGIETQFAVNYLSHFYLTHLLLPALKQGGTIGEVARVVNVSSCAHFPGDINFNDIMMEKHYDTVAAYAQSKLAQMMSTRYINKMLEDEGAPVRCYSVHPGMVNTGLFKNSIISKYFPWVMEEMFKTPEQGAVSILYACLHKDLEKKGGLYISNCSEGFSSGLSKNLEVQKRLYDMSCSFVGINKKSYGAVWFYINARNMNKTASYRNDDEL